MRNFEKWKFKKTNARHNKSRDLMDDSQLMFCKVVSSVLWSDPSVDQNAADYMWVYQVRMAHLNWTGIPNQPTISERSSAEFTAFSISELGNIGTTPNRNYSFGVPETDLPVGVVPKKIPNGTPVICSYIRSANHGQSYFLIINTQAISGPC